LSDLTDGWFTARPRGSGSAALDPSGLVKGWSIDLAADILRIAGHLRFAINGGGDIVCRAAAPESPRWRVGIRHPTERDAVAAILDVGNCAIATSGTYERGNHLWGRSGSDGATELVSVTVVGPELGTADALATAVFVEGSGEPRWFDQFPGYDPFVVTEAGRVRWTSGLDGALARLGSNPIARSDRR
jgi:thiamine biosynthesis lipoprotein